MKFFNCTSIKQNIYKRVKLQTQVPKNQSDLFLIVVMVLAARPFKPDQSNRKTGDANPKTFFSSKSQLNY